MDVGQPKTADLGDLKIVFQIAQPTIERGHVHAVPFGFKVDHHFPRPTGVAGALAIDAVQYVCHACKRIYFILP